MLILKIVGSVWDNESRDIRELSVYQEAGNDILVMAKGEAKDNGRIDEVAGFKVLRCSTRPLGHHIPSPVNRIIALFTWTHIARRLNPAIISGENLVPGLTIAWMSTLFRRNKSILIYDSHEFELGRNAMRGKLKTWLIQRWERFLMKRCALSIMVNDSIADEVQRIHRLEKRPVVVRSTPDYWKIDESSVKSVRKRLTEKFGTEKG